MYYGQHSQRPPLPNTRALCTKCTECGPPPQMADIPLDENLASILVAAQYVLGYWSVQEHSHGQRQRERRISEKFAPCLTVGRPQPLVDLRDPDPPADPALRLPRHHDRRQPQCGHRPTQVTELPPGQYMGSAGSERLMLC